MAEESQFTNSLARAMAQCSRREYCIDDIRQKLQIWGIRNNDSDKIIELLIKENFINELRYATAYTRDKFKYNKWGKIKISIHLKVKKIPSELLKQALDSIDNDHYIKTLNDLIENRKRTVKAKNPFDLKAKLLRYGLSKGFESNLLYDILNNMEE